MLWRGGLERLILRSAEAKGSDIIRTAHRFFSNGLVPKEGFLEKVTDLRLPHEWFPVARSIKRRVTLHVGPTNSGKTYAALQRLREAATGVYCGPLRLLAWETADRLNASGVPCNTITGQEKRHVEKAHHTAMTIEMADTAQKYDAAVVDEIQMMASPDRGFAFTRALLGLATPELHVCGDPAAVPLVEQFCRETGDELQVKHYERLSPLKSSRQALGSLMEVRAGDCIIAFSRTQIYNIKKEIETKTRHRCCVVYGSLPQETRSRQAALFNDEDSGYDVLVASDAVGMGLNLNIRRIIFSSIYKFDGFERRMLTSSEAKQIAGRAGRFASQYPEGEVTCLEPRDLGALKYLLKQPPETITEAGLFPTFDQLQLFATRRPNWSLNRILENFAVSARLSPAFFLQDCSDMVETSRHLGDLPLPLADMYIFAISPVKSDDPASMGALYKFAQEHLAAGKVRMKRVLNAGTMKVPKTQNALSELESLHNILSLYIWLSYRLPESFDERETAEEQKGLCEMLIEQGLKVVGTPVMRKAKTRRMIPVASEQQLP
ncbi:ATP-dependent RNA helicase [Klebsormidium nitens]|uniref:RNA helicase n=1 Tax=Klebsormidium nitens TaxID=105231 RepID=A0A1Y1HM65_KLENI|nr:ATP-dependent RNA helicase [Klebsormidium nitens]|eukprot:GAQ77657.1 ATP-dependent RNA helicase [Klebsormidium nitens]